MDVFDVSSSLETVEAELDVFQKNIFDFVIASSTEITVEQKLEISLALQSFNYSTIEEGNFAAVFTEISFSSDPTFNEQIVALSTSEQFTAITTVVDTLVVASAEADFDIETFDASEIEATMIAVSKILDYQIFSKNFAHFGHKLKTVTSL